MKTEIAGQKQKRRGAPERYLFKKGQSGNPAGKPKGTKSFDTVFEAAIRKIVKENKINIKDPEQEMVVKAIIEGLKGNYNFFKDLMDRRYGRPVQPMEFEDPEAMQEIEKLRAEIKGWLNVK